MLSRDPVWADLRNEFHLPPSQIYLDGNSLGLLSRPAEAALQAAIDAWKQHGIGGWQSGDWIDLPEALGARLAPLIGASTDAVVLTGQTTNNLHQLLSTLYDPTDDARPTILGDALNFASDHHAITSHLKLRGRDPATAFKQVTSRDGHTLNGADIVDAMTEDVQLVVLPSVLYVSGQLLDLAAISAAARDRNILIGWDLSHSIGALPHALEATGADFAFWCNYKYLNAGPGAIGGLFLHPRHHDQSPGLAGWWGVRSDRRFNLDRTHEPAAGAARLQVGTPPILSLAPLAGSLDLFDRAGGIDAVRQRSLALTEQLLARIDRDLIAEGFEVITPSDPAERGGHVALQHPAAGQICPALRDAGVVPDYRHPGVLRLAPCAFYTSPAEVDEAVDRLVEVMRTKAYQSWPAVATAAP
jgi:kynureninase